jgi:hypothetical protein
VNEFDATKILYHLAEAGYVEALEEPSASAPPETRLDAVVAGMNELLRLVAAAIPAEGRPAFLAGVRAFLADGTNPLAPVWARAAHAADGALDATAVLANVNAIKGAVLSRLEPSGDRARLGLEALRELLFFYLFLAGERLAREADEAVATAVKRKLAGVEGLVGDA